MDLGALLRVLDAACQEMGSRSDAAPDGGPSVVVEDLTVEVGLQVVRGADGHERLELVEGTPAVNAALPVGGQTYHRLKLTLKGGKTAGASAAAGSRSVARSALSDSVILADAESEVAAGGDQATMDRRLEILLGGPPGFVTGAKAEILADLLREFGRPVLLETLQRVWISKFDTGADASPSVSKG